MLYTVKLKDKDDKITTLDIGSPCLEEAQRDANQTAKNLKKKVVSVERKGSPWEEQDSWGDRTKMKF